MSISRSWKDYIYYFVIGILSLIMLFFMPMMGSVAGLTWVLPTTVAGWVVYVISKLAAAAFNVLIFHCFNKQGKINILYDGSYLEARQLLMEAEEQFVKHPRNPSQYNHDIYRTKGITIFITTILGTVGFSQAILTFNGTEFLVQLVTVVVGLIFGILQMKDTEGYWTCEYLEYAKEVHANYLKEHPELLPQPEPEEVVEEVIETEELILNEVNTDV